MNPAKEIRRIAKMVTATDLAAELEVYSKPGYSTVYLELTKYLSDNAEVKEVTAAAATLSAAIDKARKVFSKNGWFTVSHDATHADGEPHMRTKSDYICVCARLALTAGKPLSKTYVATLAKELSTAVGTKVLFGHNTHDF